jgi:DNA repair photolyase
MSSMPLKTVSGDFGALHKGRGATLNPEGRFENQVREAFDDGWEGVDEDGAERPRTVVTAEKVKSIISRNDSPDVPFTYSINPYRGCEHGCIYCYARPTHAYLNLSPGLDFETRILAKINAADCLSQALARPGYRCETIALGANTDPYQPAEREWKITRSVLQVAAACNQPLGIVTKNSLVERDLDLLGPMAAKGLVVVYLSVTTLDPGLARRMEPRATAPMRRLETIRRLSAAGVPVGVLVAPVVPFLTDADMEHILDEARAAGATSAAYVLLRLPHEVKDLFRDWLAQHYPLKAAHVMSRVQQMREGRDNDPEFGSRMRGSGVFAQMLAHRFEVACRRLGFNRARQQLDCTLFRPPSLHGQLDLFL